MRKTGKVALAVAGVVALGAAAALPAVADDSNQLIRCVPTRADAAAVSLEGLRFGVKETHVWASARVHLAMRDGSVRIYVLNGRAEPIAKRFPPNQSVPGFAYPGFSCTIQFPAITSVQNCGGSNERRSCDVGLRLFGAPAAFAVSLTAQRTKVLEAAAIP